MISDDAHCVHQNPHVGVEHAIAKRFGTLKTSCLCTGVLLWGADQGAGLDATVDV
jgi:hypothetical protein